MANPYDTLAQSILERSEFLADYQSLFISYMYKTIGDEYEEISTDVAVRLARTAQILVASGVPRNIDIGVRIIDMFLELDPPYLEDMLIVAEEVFGLLGDFPNITLINQQWNDRRRFDRSLPAALATQMHRDMNSLEVLAIEGTHFQVDLWDSLEDGEDVVAIAPTSTGKSYIIMEHLIHRMSRDREQVTFAAYVVPSRALIHEVSKKMQRALAREGIDWIEVATIGQRDRSYENSTIFVVTQERLLMLLHFQQLMKFVYVVVDEAQNIASDSRGVLLHIALTRVMDRGPVRLVFSTPSEDYRESFVSVLARDPKILETPHSPVGKNIIEVGCAGRHIFLKSKYPPAEVRVPKRFTGTAIADIIHRLGAHNGNIVYANTTSKCEKLAGALASRMIESSEDLTDAADYIRTTVHEDSVLASCIERGVAYHYGPLPRHVRIMVEGEVEGGTIDYLVCTSTLAEGVNLPAKNLFIHDPKIRERRGKVDKPMPSVQYKNIVGRAGRLMTHFSGNVFLLNFDSWTFPECVEDTVEPKLPTYIWILREHLEAVLGEFNGIDAGGDLDRQALNATVNKLIQDEQRGVLVSSLQDHLPETALREISSAVETLLESVELPSAILELNPGIGVRQQNDLCTAIREYDDLTELWPVHPQTPEFPAHLEQIMRLTYECGVLQMSGLDNDRFAKKVLNVAVQWVRGRPLKEIIGNSIRYGRKGVSVDAVVRNTVGLLNNEIGFRLAAAIKCFIQVYVYCADLRDIDTDDAIEIYPYLEIGASDPLSIRLISSGLSRETALQVRDDMPDLSLEDQNILQSVLGHEAYGQLHPMTRREIESLRG